MDNLSQADQLLKWTEQQQLNRQQLQQATQRLALQPASADWLRQANRLLLFSATVLLGCALIFFFAYNWPLMPYLGKLALAGAAVLLSGIVAVLSSHNGLARRAALFVCSIVSGALLALIGQTYQTGADIWQLFTAWAALITPLVLLSKSRGSYLLWFVLLELALWRYLDSQSGFWLFDSARQLQLFTLANAVLLLFCEFALPRLGVVKHKPLLWLATLALLLPLTIGGIIGVWESRYQLNLLCYLLLATALTWWFWRLQRDVLIVALLLFSGIAVSTAVLAQVLDSADSFFLVNLLAMYVIGSSAGAAIWLKKLLQEARHDQ
ncbi:DUF2157 domain-containing protein [Rheinheimera pleomorphica]|uniref:DUF2157 domain-containing protein n=1 Tax=Rheinheimera pleomorphica TaxID=2703963 RepID=UPI001421E7CF|nr:DUF2157 domain-containing protein [Rheinheimera pleomorphica]